jgi:glutathione S-transferase
MSTPELLQFPYSNFNEKARWAFDWKGVPHRRTNLLPGPHMARVRRIAPDPAASW